MSYSGLGILEALENLNTLVDVDSLEEVEVTEGQMLVAHKSDDESLKADYWVKAGSDEQTLDAIRATFLSVHNYLQAFYAKTQYVENGKNLIEGINTVMVLVGEAARKLDQYGKIFKLQVSEFQEYQDLQIFYRTKVIKEIFHDFAKEPIKQEVEIADEVEETAGVHLLNDLDVIKRDHIYELFYLKNEAGHDFYSADLARRIKLACDFGVFTEEYFGEDPLLQIINWEDKALHLLGAKILEHAHIEVKKFYDEAMRYKELPLVASVHNAVMALMLSCNSRNLIRQFSGKGCHLYFHDFLFFLRSALTSREYQRMQIYSVPEGQPFFESLMNLVSTLIHALYTLGPDRKEMGEALKGLIDRSKTKLNGHLSNRLAQSNKALFDSFKHHPNGPVFNALDLVRDEQLRIFDPLMQGNIPEVQAVIHFGDKKVKLLRMACPITQHLINQAYITEEFKCYLRGLHDHHLYFNFQDRTSWREHARCIALEQVGSQAEFAETLSVVTLASDTDFYLQSGIYRDLSAATNFIAHFSEHLGDESTGFHFPQRIKLALFPQFIDQLLKQVHETFFSKNSVLSHEDRILFISIAYTFIELKILEITDSKYLTLSSKDGLDTTANQTMRLLALLSVSKADGMDQDRLNTLFFGPTLMSRQRVVHQEQFDRTIGMIRLLERTNAYLSSFEHLFDKKTLDGHIEIL